MEMGPPPTPWWKIPLSFLTLPLYHRWTVIMRDAIYLTIEKKNIFWCVHCFLNQPTLSIYLLYCQNKSFADRYLFSFVNLETPTHVLKWPFYADGNHLQILPSDTVNLKNEDELNNKDDIKSKITVRTST